MSKITDAITQSTFIPALLDIFADDVTYTINGVSTEIQVVFAADVVAVGEYGERMEQRTTCQAPDTFGLAIGGVLVTHSTPPVQWTIVQLVETDGIFSTWAIRQIPI